MHKVKTNIDQGLTAQEVAQEIALGHQNVSAVAVSKKMSTIFRQNIVTLFNGINFLLFVLVVIAQRPLNGMFALVLISNTLIGIYQEIKAKRTLEQLALIHQHPVRILRDGVFIEVPIDHIVKHDVLQVDAGGQIVVDGIVRSEHAEIDESLLTGESHVQHKKEGDRLLSGSFVIAGTMLMQVTEVGNFTYASKLAQAAQQFTLSKSEVMHTIKQIITLVTWIIIPLGGLLFWTQLTVGHSSWQVAILATVGGVIGMIPEGLVLLTSVAFMLGAIRLAKIETLVQELPAIEGLARVNTLCLDKTGTLTEGVLTFETMLELNDRYRMQIEDALGAIGCYIPAANATQIAVQKAFPKTRWSAAAVIQPFSSERKWSGLSFSDEGSWIFGAPDVIKPIVDHVVSEVVLTAQQQGKRVLGLYYSSDMIRKNQLPRTLELVCYLVFSDAIRLTAAATLDYFAQQEVQVKIISGDDVQTVSSIAQQAGVMRATELIDGPSLPQTVEQMQEIVKQYTIFGRVTPMQKQQLIEAMQCNGDTVAMVGDGVNDVLALKQADCGIAMATGSEATRAVAQLVLLHSDFAALPKVVAEGRKVMNNITNVASLYLIKTMYSIGLSLIVVVLRWTYPFIPLQLTIISTLMVGIPTLLVALEGNTARVKQSMHSKILQDTLPSGSAIISGIVVVFACAQMLNWSDVVRSTVAYIVLGFLQAIVLCFILRPWKIWKISLLISLIVVFLATLYVTQVHTQLFLTRLTLGEYVVTSAIIVMSSLLLLLNRYVMNMWVRKFVRK